MRVMVLVKATRDSEASVMPTTAQLTEMGQYNEELVNAGMLLAGDGLHPSARGARIQFAGDNRTVVNGPFAEAKDLVSGYWIWQVKSMDEAIAWAKRCPFRNGELELRPVFEAEDFGPAYTPELREQEERLRAQSEAQNKS